jgi:hypothetical protein
VVLPVANLLGLARSGTRDVMGTASRLVEPLVGMNRRALEALGVQVQGEMVEGVVGVRVMAGGAVGAVPLRSPVNGKGELGLVVRPRFGWKGIGAMLGETGWKVVPEPLALPMMQRSERRVPPWVLSSMVLLRMEAMLRGVVSRFEQVEEDVSAPKGSVDWGKYASRRVAAGRALEVPCRFLDRREDRRLLGAARFVLEKQLTVLEGQREAGAFVLGMMERARGLLRRVSVVGALEPTPREFAAWLLQPLRRESWVQGIQAMEWTVEERGLAGVSDLQGVPWKLQMEAFFEAWVETVLVKVAADLGGVLRVGRRAETQRPIVWEPAYLGSQKSIVPDFWMDVDGVAVVVDAKYKRHWEEMQRGGWGGLQEEMRERHRADLFQVLAYAGMSDRREVMACLIYPCEMDTWENLLERGRRIHQAEIVVGERRLRLWLVALPMGAAARELSAWFTQELGTAIRSGS